MANIVNTKSLLFVLFVFVLAKGKIQKTSEQDEFVPTSEWQVVKEGQPLPKGLHIRINLQTGEKEAKLLNPLEDKTKAVLPITNEEQPSQYPESDLKKKLKNIKNEAISSEGTSQHPNKYKSYEELKLELKELNLNPKTDLEVLKNLIDKFKKLKNAQKFDLVHTLTVMEDLDFLIHQHDNAIEFVRLKGFEEVIYTNLNSTIVEIKRESLRLMGSLVQNNAKVQIYALQTGALDFLLRTLVLNADITTKNRAVFALSCLLRGFPLAQFKFVENAGLNVFYQIVTNTNNIKIQLKIVTLINDLVFEYLEALKDKEKIAHYNKIDLKNKLQELQWCKYLTILLKNVYEIDHNDHDSLEKSLNAILSIVDSCKPQSLRNVQDILKVLQRRYSTFAVTDEQLEDSIDAEYSKHMEGLCSAIINYNNIIQNIKLEL